MQVLPSKLDTFHFDSDVIFNQGTNILVALRSKLFLHLILAHITKPPLKEMCRSLFKMIRAINICIWTCVPFSDPTCSDIIAGIWGLTGRANCFMGQWSEGTLFSLPWKCFRFGETHSSYFECSSMLFIKNIYCKLPIQKLKTIQIEHY